MRVKLVLIASLLAAIVGAGVPVLIVILAFGPASNIANANFVHRSHLTELLIFLPPLVTALLAGVFVYRHTARRRKLQAGLTFIMAILFSMSGHLVVVLTSAIHRR